MTRSDRLVAEEEAAAPTGASPAAFRYRIRFRKEGLLRFIGHNDLLRTWHRLLRRTGLPLRSTQGFHAKTKLSSPIPLALGLEGIDEVLDIELTRNEDPDEIKDRLHQESPDGLSVASVQRREARGGLVACVEYDCRIEGAFAREQACGLRDRFLASPSWIVDRALPGKKPRSVDIRSKSETIAIEAHRVRLRIRVENGSTVRPEEILGALGLSGAVREGRVGITRTRVEFAEPANER